MCNIKDAWIGLGGAIVGSILTVTGVVISTYLSHVFQIRRERIKAYNRLFVFAQKLKVHVIL